MAESVGNSKSGKSSGLSRGRVLLIGVLLALVGCLLASGILLKGLVENTRQRKLATAQRKITDLISQSRVIATAYLRDRKELRRRIGESLTREASTVCSDVQVFLQAALVKKEAEQVQREYTAIKSQRNKLAKLAMEQARKAGDFTKKVTSPIPAASTQTSTDGIAVDTTDVNSFFSSSSTSSTFMTEEEKQQKLKKLADDFLKEQENDLSIVNALSANDNSLALKDGWPLELLRESGPDLESLLPDNCTFTVAQAGGKLLMALGGGKARLDEVRGEASKTLLFSASSTSYHWVLRTVLADISAPAAANITELSAILAERLGIEGISQFTLSGYIFDAEGTVKSSFGDETSGVYPPPGQSRWLHSINGSSYYQRSTPLTENNWSMAFRVYVPRKSIEDNLRELAQAHPLYAGGFAVALVLLLTGIIAVSILAWRNNPAGGVGLSTLEKLSESIAANPTTRSNQPQLGSLQRLQQANRGRNMHGSKILDMAQSPVLRELAKRIRSNPQQTTGQSDLRKYV